MWTTSYLSGNPGTTSTLASAGLPPLALPVLLRVALVSRQITTSLHLVCLCQEAVVTAQTTQASICGRWRYWMGSRASNQRVCINSSKGDNDGIGAKSYEKERHREGGEGGGSEWGRGQANKESVRKLSKGDDLVASTRSGAGLGKRRKRQT
jgi:hypothetical protein